MHVRLIVHGDLDGNRWPFWKDFSDPVAVPRVGDVVDLGVGTGAEPDLNERIVTRVRWSKSLDFVDVTLADMHVNWLQANRIKLVEAGWLPAVAGAG